MSQDGGAAVHAGSYVTTSDKRLKKNVNKLDDAVSKLMKLNPVSYSKKTTLSDNQYSIYENGFIAQELQKIMPKLVLEGSDENKLLSINYVALIPVLTKAIQEQQEQIELLKEEIKTLSKEKMATAELQQGQIDELTAMVEILFAEKTAVASTKND